MRIELITDFEIDVEKEFGLKKLKGKRVISKDGEVIGRVKDIIIKQYKVVGIVVKKLFRRPLFISRTFFDSFTEKAVILKINPVTAIAGLAVLDSDGKNVGKVKSITRTTAGNEFDSIIIKKGLFGKKRVIPAENVEKISEYIILNIEVE